jgi:hypothetical protein
VQCVQEEVECVQEERRKLQVLCPEEEVSVQCVQEDR